MLALLRQPTRPPFRIRHRTYNHNNTNHPPRRNPSPSHTTCRVFFLYTSSASPVSRAHIPPLCVFFPHTSPHNKPKRKQTPKMPREGTRSATGNSKPRVFQTVDTAPAIKRTTAAPKTKPATATTPAAATTTSTAAGSKPVGVKKTAAPKKNGVGAKVRPHLPLHPPSNSPTTTTGTSVYGDMSTTTTTTIMSCLHLRKPSYASTPEFKLIRFAKSHLELCQYSHHASTELHGTSQMRELLTNTGTHSAGESSRPQGRGQNRQGRSQDHKEGNITLTLCPSPASDTANSLFRQRSRSADLPRQSPRHK